MLPYTVAFEAKRVVHIKAHCKSEWVIGTTALKDEQEKEGPPRKEEETPETRKNVKTTKRPRAARQASAKRINILTPTAAEVNAFNEIKTALTKNTAVVFFAADRQLFVDFDSAFHINTMHTKMSFLINRFSIPSMNDMPM